MHSKKNSKPFCMSHVPRPILTIAVVFKPEAGRFVERLEGCDPKISTTKGVTPQWPYEFEDFNSMGIMFHVTLH